MPLKNIATLAGFIVLCVGVGAAGGLISGPDDWYWSLRKPAFTPPPWIFAPVWTTLYTLMGVSAWLVWRERTRQRVGVPLTLFFVQLGFNAIWSPLFFGLHRIDLALIDIIALWLMIVLTIKTFARVKPVAAWLVSPYLVWVSFASVLNASFWWLNR
jgi:tryptophan-rich sensory protein